MKLTKEQIDEIMEFCYQNNTITTKYPDLRLMTLDGGWVNVLELRKFLEGETADDFDDNFSRHLAKKLKRGTNND